MRGESYWILPVGDEDGSDMGPGSGGREKGCIWVIRR